MVSKYNVAFPLYARLDDGGMKAIESFEKILYHLEVIDIENDEYLFWDANGQGLKVLIKNEQVSGFQVVENDITLQEAFLGYAKQLGAPIDTSGTPEQTWARLQNIKESLPRRKGLFSRLINKRTK